MQDEVNERTVALSIKTAKLTGRVLADTFSKCLAMWKKQRQAALAPHGRQTVRQLMGHGGSTNSIPLKGDAGQFDRIARKWGVDYAFHKVGTQDYLLFFTAGQADAITAAFSEYTRRVMAKEQDKPSLLRQLRKFREFVQNRSPERKRTREAVKEER